MEMYKFKYEYYFEKGSLGELLYLPRGSWNEPYEEDLSRELFEALDEIMFNVIEDYLRRQCGIEESEIITREYLKYDTEVDSIRGDSEIILCNNVEHITNRDHLNIDLKQPYESFLNQYKAYIDAYKKIDSRIDFHKFKEIFERIEEKKEHE